MLRKLLEHEEGLDKKAKNVQIKSSLNMSRAVDVDHLVDGRNTCCQQFMED